MATEAAVAGAVVYEAVETVAQIGIGAYFVAKPTMPLKARLTQIATSGDDATRLSLARINHTLSVVDNKAYIFGGETASNKLASNDIHAVTVEQTDKPEPEYSLIPAVPKAENGKVPIARTKHAACAFNVCVAVYGGVDESGRIINEDSTIWLFRTDSHTWESLEASNKLTHAPKARSGASLFEHQNNLILYGGSDESGVPLKDTWHYDYTNNLWSQLLDAPVSSPNAALSDGVLHVISAGTDSMSSDLHFLPLLKRQSEEEQKWHTVEFPTNPLTPGPLPRVGAGLVPVSTGYGRQYLLYLFGAQTTPTSNTDTAQASTTDLWSDLWTYQLPSSTPEVKLTTNIYEAMKPAKIKDAIRSAIGVDSGKHSWHEVEVLPPADLTEAAGKVHPGPRSSFACDVMKDKKGIVLWGGANPKGEREGDGWLIRLE